MTHRRLFWNYSGYNDVCLINEQKLSNTYPPLWWHLKLLTKPQYSLKNKDTYEIEIPIIDKCYTDNEKVKIIRVYGSGIVADKLKSYLNLITTLDDVQGDNAVYYANISIDIIKYLLEYLEEQNFPYVNIEWAVPPEIITI